LNAQKLLKEKLLNVLPFHQHQQEKLSDECSQAWQRSHMHVLIQVRTDLPVYCVVCRRNKRDIMKLERLAAEERHR